jgi:hypothetical protein
VLYRKLNAETGDYSIGQGMSGFWDSQPEAVAQAVKTRLGLWLGEWFLDTRIGTPYLEDILGMGKVKTYDFAIQKVMAETFGVRSIAEYSSYLDSNARSATVYAMLDTIYGQAQFKETISL